MKYIFALSIAAAVVCAVTPVSLLSQASAPARDTHAGQPKPGWQTNETALRALAFGPVTTNGLRAACYLLPAKEVYAEGDCLTRHVVFHNSGKESIVFSVRGAGDDDLCTVTDDQGHHVPMTDISFTAISPVQTFRLQPGEVVDVDRYYTTVLGERANGGPSAPASTLIRAKPGTVCRLSWGIRLTDAGNPLAIKTGQLSFRVRPAGN